MKDLGPELAGCPRGNYGDKYQEHLLEQYKILVASAVATSERRGSMNSFLLAVNTALASTVGVLLGTSSITCWHVVLPICGVAIGVSWIAMIRSYKDLNAAKFRVIHELEDALPARLFEREWDLLKKSNYRHVSVIELYVPAVFIVIYVVGIASILAHCGKSWLH